MALLEQEEEFVPEPGTIVSDLEATLKGTFPALLKRIWSIGGELKLLARGFRGQYVGGYLLALRKPHVEHVSSTILESHRLFKDNFPGIIPIASHLDGNYLVLDYRFHREPTIPTYDLDLAETQEQPFIFAAASFDELADRGQPDRQPHYDLQDQKVSPESLTKGIGFSSAATFCRLPR
ncbi:MAG TPA: SMI1/KNR4 family protein [Prosthecobacter sp.]|nr:SMI1/KNR4 family protein [Prosthecobacter sp.]